MDLPGLSADVRFGPGAQWPVTVREPGAMGWYAWVPTMECYHGVVSLDHALGGWIDTGAGRVDLAGGRGYLEKDWGTAFPKAYVWMQSNHFEETGVSLVASTALIPWRSAAFRGDLVALHLPEGRDAGLHRFTSYTRARTVDLVVDDQEVRWSLESPGGDRLDLTATIGGRTTGLLHSPVRTEMHQRVAETLDGTLEVRLARRLRTDPFRGRRAVRGGRGPRRDRPVAGHFGQVIAGPSPLSGHRQEGGGRLAPRRGADAPHTNRRKHGQG